MTLPVPTFLGRPSALHSTLLAVAAIAACAASTARAVPYASGVRNTTGDTWEFVLNEGADLVTIKRDGGSPITIPSPTAGRYSFDLTGFAAFDIEVAKDAPAGLTRISNSNNPFAKYTRPSGLAINRDPASPYFGTLYVANSVSGATSGTGSRSVGDGVYSLTADLQGVDLSTPGWSVPNANDASQAKIGEGWRVGNQSQGSGFNSPFRIALDDGGNVIVGDWSDANGGLKYLGPNLTGGGLVLAIQEGPTPGVIDPAGPFDGSGSPFVHGSIRSQPNVTGTLGVDLVVRAIDEDLSRNPRGYFDGTYPNPQLPETGFDGFPIDGNHVWKWDVGAETNSFVKPQLLIDVGTSNDPADRQLGTDSSGMPFQFGLNLGLRANAEFFPQIGDNGLWVLSEPRGSGDSSGIVIVEVDENDPSSRPNVLWSSRQFTIDNGLDGYPNDPSPGGPDPNSDVFRNTGTVEVSPDGSTLYVHRWLVDDPSASNVNPYLGRDSAYPGAILAIPLDEDGLPLIQIDDNGTPLDAADDLFTNFNSVATSSGLANKQQYEIAADAAGNLIITDGRTQLIEAFSPGGNTLTRFSFDGVNRSFSVTPIPEPSSAMMTMAALAVVGRCRRRCG